MSGSEARVGVLANARAGSVRADPGFVSRLQARLGEARVRLTGDPAEIAPALEELRAAGVSLLVLVGGDGTVGGTLTELLAHWPADRRPAVSVAAGGTVNTIARSLGALRSPEEQVQQLVARGARESSLRPLVCARADGAPTRAGMIFALGAAVRFLRLYYEESPLGARGAAAVTARVTASALRGGRLAREVFAKRPVEIEVDGAPIAPARFSVMGASSVSHIGLGFRPFHEAGRSPDRFHFITSDASAARLALELPAQRLPFALPGTCLHHFAARRVSLRFEAPEPWSLDADLRPAADRIELEASAPLRFVAA